ncbi:MAG: hypothetical protein KAW61_09255 [candidate division Zixibacteria bacterium]|nr:hypothetical protein [candidate division Zixibacteria bacterium]
MCENLYPGIDVWYRKKVLSGLDLRERTAYLLYEDYLPVGATILKRGPDAKICSLRILPDAEAKGYGKLLMALAARDLRTGCNNVHFTIPAHIWETRWGFFNEFGMKYIGPTKNQYRLFDEEHYCGGRFADMWANVVQSLPRLIRNVTINGYRFDYDLVMSLHPEHAESILNGRKRVEIRRRFSSKWKDSIALIYSTDPIRSFVGSFQIANVVKGSPDEIWYAFSAEIGCCREEFFRYAASSTTVYAIVVGERHEFGVPLTKTHAAQLVSRDINAPQSYTKVNSDSVMQEVASISTLLQSMM